MISSGSLKTVGCVLLVGLSASLAHGWKADTVSIALPFTASLSMQTSTGNETMKDNAPREDSGYQLRDGDASYGDYYAVRSEVMDRELPVLVFLPEGYDQTDRPWPVVYLLHGVNKRPLTETGLREMHNPGSRLQEYATAYQVIIVAPQTGRSFYLDSPLKPNHRFATFCGEELPAWTDEHFRTEADRKGRILAGFSMGGYGAVSLLCRYPDTFSVALSRGGLQNLTTGVEDLMWDDVPAEMVGLLGDYWSNRKPYHQNSCINLTNHIRQRGDCGIVLEVGREDFLYKTNLQLHQHLKEIGVEHIYAEYPGGHVWNAQTLGSLLAHMQYFRQTFP